MQIIPYHAALAMMKAGRVNHRPEDLLCFGTGVGRVFYMDTRSKLKPDTEPDIVYPLGVSSDGKWFWVCPTCGTCHCMTRKQIKQEPTITCENRISKYKRYGVGPDGRKCRVPVKPIKLVADYFGW